ATLLNVGDREEVIAAWAGETGAIEVDRDAGLALAAYAPVPSLGWAVTVVEENSSAYADADALARRGLTVTVVAVALVLLGGWSLGGRLNRNHAATVQAQRAEASARASAEAALKARDEFISIASHELRNPVATIRGFGQLMQRRLDRGALSEDDLHEYASSISASGEHLSRLVDDLLSVSRLEGDRLQLRFEEVDVVALLERAAADAPLTEHILQLRSANGPVVAEIDADRVHQIFVNLLE